MIDQLLQLILSLVGILLLAALAARFWPQEQTLNGDRVKRALARFSESKTASASIISAEQTAALARIDDSELALLHIMGDRVTVCPLKAANIKAAAWEGTTLTLFLDNFTKPRTTLTFGSDGDRALAEMWLSSLAQEPAA